MFDYPRPSMCANTKKTYFFHIDGMRAIAVLAVVAYHLNSSWLPGGFSGVDVFFVISGFVVSASVGAHSRLGLASFIALFYARRMIRIGPALVVTLLATAIASAVLIPPAWLSGSNQQTGFYAFFGLSNFILAKNNNDYFSPTTEFNPYTHTWSLGIEEQFYFAFPFLFFLWLREGRWRWASLWLFLSALVASITYSAWVGAVDKTLSFYMITSRFWQLAIGVVLFQVLTLGGRRFGQLKAGWGGLFLVGATASIVLLGYGLIASKAHEFPFPGALASVLGTVGLLVFLHGDGRDNYVARILTAVPLVFIGRISYSLYLWHWPVFVLFRWTVGLDGAFQQVLAVSIAFSLAVASYYWVESPIRHFRSLSRVPRYFVVGVGVVALSSSAWLASFINGAQASLSISTVSQNAKDWYPYGEDSSPEFTGCVVQVTNNAISTGFVLDFSLHGCDRQITAPRIFAIGDSHAIGYEALFKGYVLKTGARVSVYNNGGCPFISLQPWREDSEHCRRNTADAVADILSKVAPGDVVFLPSLRLPRFADQWVRFPDAEVAEKMFSDWAAAARDGAVADAEKLLLQFEAKGARIVFEAPKPIFRSPTFRCADAHNATNGICGGGSDVGKSEIESLRMPVMEALSKLAASVSSVSIWDPLPILCGEQSRCSAYSGKRPLFFDGDHISGYGSKVVLPSFVSFVRGEADLDVISCVGAGGGNRECEARRLLGRELNLGERIEFDERSLSRGYLQRGWSAPEAWGTWAAGPTAEILLPVTGTPRVVVIEAGALVTDSHPVQTVAVRVNDVFLTNLRLTDRWRNVQEILIPSGIDRRIARGGLLKLEFEFIDSVSPRKLNLGDDDREISLGITALTLR